MSYRSRLREGAAWFSSPTTENHCAFHKLERDGSRLKGSSTALCSNPECHKRLAHAWHHANAELNIQPVELFRTCSELGPSQDAFSQHETGWGLTVLIFRLAV